MSHKIKYKIISFSSEQQQFPVSSIQVPGSDGWQTKRFCNYPQQVTLEFYGVAHITKIQILVDTRKIPSSADILYYDPTESATDSRFSKYGSLQFSRNQSGRIHEQKTVMVDMNCLYLRFLFHKPFKNKQNFFSQISVHQITVYGGETSIGLDDFSKKAQLPINSNSLGEEEDQFVYEKLMDIQSKKQRAIEEEDYDEAQRYKQIMKNIKKLGYILKDFRNRKQDAIEQQKYDEAKQIKDSIQRTKREIQELINQDMIDQEEQMMENQGNLVDHDVQGNEFVGLQINQMLHKQNIEESRVTHKSHKSQKSQKNSRVTYNKSGLNKSKVNYDDRVISVNRVKTQELSQFPDQNQEQNKAHLQPQEIDGKYISDAQLMQPFFEEEVIKKFFSKHWQLKQEALQQILSTSKSKAQNPTIIKCLLRVVINSISQTNFKVSLQSLHLLDETLKINSTTHKLNRSLEMNSDLDKILNQIIKKMSDNNPKIKTTSDSLFQQIVKSSLYGVQICSLALMKVKLSVMLSNKQQVERLKSLTNLVTNYGLGQNGAPYSVIDYAVDKLNNRGVQVRNEAVVLLANCANIEQQRVYEKLQSKKGIFLQQVETKREQLKGNGPAKKKK